MPLELAVPRHSFHLTWCLVGSLSETFWNNESLRVDFSYSSYKSYTNPHGPHHPNHDEPRDSSLCTASSASAGSRHSRSRSTHLRAHLPIHVPKELRHAKLQINRGHYITNPNNALLQEKTLKITIPLQFLIPQKIGNLMPPDQTQQSGW